MIRALETLKVPYSESRDTWAGMIAGTPGLGADEVLVSLSASGNGLGYQACIGEALEDEALGGCTRRGDSPRGDSLAYEIPTSDDGCEDSLVNGALEGVYLEDLNLYLVVVPLHNYVTLASMASTIGAEYEGNDARAAGGCEVASLSGSSNWTSSLYDAPLTGKDVLVHQKAFNNDSFLILAWKWEGGGLLHSLLLELQGEHLPNIYLLLIHDRCYNQCTTTCEIVIALGIVSSATNVGVALANILDIHGLALIPNSITTL
ncbi:hypothetical protein HAX54_026643 [Datura stramonium]|uniref:Uncharacterized protein n=1 Tax=Datura stramonium TaxID=4076 RepID=A0ABS8V1M7_DATST|nr:hypothetical protein [Datura stramonium]